MENKKKPKKWIDTDLDSKVYNCFSEFTENNKIPVGIYFNVKVIYCEGKPYEFFINSQSDKPFLNFPISSNNIDNYRSMINEVINITERIIKKEMKCGEQNE